MNYYVNEDIKNTVRISSDEGRYGYYRYDMNENPEGLPLEFVEDVKKEITPEFLSIYPETSAFMGKYANYIGVDKSNVLTTNGSDMAIRYIFETFGEKGKNVVSVSPTFAMYMVECNILGYKYVPVECESDFSVNIKKVLDAITEDTRIVVLVYPNNPIGNIYTEEEVKRVIDKAKSYNAIVVIDEAYHYFYPGTFIQAAINEDNVIVIRTFSKCLSLAALRFGVIISNPQIIQYLYNGRLSYDANAVALLFAERLIDHPELITQLIESEKEGKKYTLENLEAKGYDCRDCKGNFIFVTPKTDPYILAKRLAEERKVLVHTFGKGLLEKYIRVSIGSRAAMKIFLDAFLDIDNE